MTTTATGPLKLIGATAYRTFRVVWMLEELGVDYQHIVAHPRSKVALQYHPLGKVPVLVDGDVTVIESCAIVTYLGDKYQRFTPPVPRPLYDEAVFTVISELDAQGLWIHRKHEKLAKVFGEAPQAVVEAKRTFECSNKMLAKQLSSDYILGKEFSAADVLYVHTLDWAQAIGWNEGWADEADKGTLNEYLERCRSRPAYQKAIAKRQAEIQEEKQRRAASKKSRI